MIAFLMKSTFSLLVVYLAYVIFLEKENMPIFKRFVLLGGIVFSFIISALQIRVIIPTATVFATSVQNVLIDKSLSAMNSLSNNYSFVQFILVTIYTIGFCLLLIRFLLNVLKLFRLQKSSPSVEFDGIKLILVNHNSLPYSFLTSIFVDEQEYKQGNITKELLYHELAHVRQKHSVDIIFIELLQMFFWFNPVIWLFKNAMQLNHEYLADKAVVAKVQVKDYQNFILKIALRNNSSYLASSFNYSLTRKRLIMLSKNLSTRKAFIKVIGLSVIITMLSATIAFGRSEAIQPPKSEFIKELNLSNQNNESIDLYDFMHRYEGDAKNCKEINNCSQVNKSNNTAGW